MTQSQTSTVLILSALLLTVFLAGCATVTDPAAEQPGGGDASIPAPSTEGEARQTFVDAFRAITGDANATQPSDGPDRMSFSVEISDVDTGRTQASMGFLMDTVDSIMLMSMSGEAFTGDTGDPEGAMMMDGIFGDDSFVIASYHKTTFFGSTDKLSGFYNESAEPIEDWDDAKDASDPDTSGDEDEEGGEDPTDPMSFLEDLQEIPPNASFSFEETTYQGDAALEVHLAYENATGSVDMTVVLLLDPPFEGIEDPLPARIEATFHDTTAEEDDASNGKMIFEFGYEDGATHEMLAGIERAESLVFTNTSAMEDAFGGFETGDGADQSDESSGETFTIQPALNAGTVPLTEVEARLVEDARGFEEGNANTSTLLTLPLEDETVEDDQLRLTYTDTDGDGHVSEGDTIRIEELSNETASYRLQLYDEETGLAVTPGMGLWAALGVLALAAVAAGRRG